MKKSLLAIAFAVATMPLTFAAQNKPAANPPANSSTPNATSTTKTKKHHKKAKTAPKSGSSTTPSK